MSNNVDITLTGDSRGAEQALNKVTAQNDKLSRQLENLRDKSKKTGDAAAGGMSKTQQMTLSATKAVTGMVAGYVSLSGAIRLAISEQEKLARIQEAARMANITPAQAIREAKINFVPDQTLSREQFVPQINQSASDIGISRGDVAKAIGPILSAKGELSAGDAFQILGDVSKINRDPEFLRTVGVAVASLAQETGNKDFKQLIGFIVNQQSQSFVQNLKPLAENVIPAVSNLISRGADPERAAELAALLTQTSQDATGSEVATALVRTADKLKEFAPKQATKGKHKGQFVSKNVRGDDVVIPAEQIKAFEAAAVDPTQQIEVLRRSPELREAFIPSLPVGRVKQPMINLLENETKTLAKLKGIEEGILPLGPGQVRNFRELGDFTNEGQEAILEDTERMGESRREQLLVENTIDARRAAARKEFQEALDKSNFGFGANAPGSFALNQTLNLKSRIPREGETPEDDALNALRNLHTINRRRGVDNRFVDAAVETIEEQQRRFGDGLIDAEPPDAPNSREQSRLQHQQRSAQIALNKASNAGDDMEMKKQTAILAEISRKLDGGSPPRQTARPASRVSRGANE